MTNFILIVGGGKFGLKAIDYVKKKGYIGLVIDQSESCSVQKVADYQISSIKEFIRGRSGFKPGSIVFLQGEISIVLDLLTNGDIPSYIIPVVPIHLMAAIFHQFFQSYGINIDFYGQGLDDFIQTVDPKLLLDYSREHGVVFLSYAKKDEICPDGCYGPPDYCPNFKRKKPITLTDYVRNQLDMSNKEYLFLPSKSLLKVLLESTQLIGGLGGIDGTTLSQVLYLLNNEIKFFQKNTFDLIVGTTCNCHGVVSFFTKS